MVWASRFVKCQRSFFPLGVSTKPRPSEPHPSPLITRKIPLVPHKHDHPRRPRAGETRARSAIAPSPCTLAPIPSTTPTRCWRWTSDLWAAVTMATMASRERPRGVSVTRDKACFELGVSWWGTVQSHFSFMSPVSCTHTPHPPTAHRPIHSPVHGQLHVRYVRRLMGFAPRGALIVLDCPRCFARLQ